YTYPLSLHDALPIYEVPAVCVEKPSIVRVRFQILRAGCRHRPLPLQAARTADFEKPAHRPVVRYVRLLSPPESVLAAFLRPDRRGNAVQPPVRMPGPLPGNHPLLLTGHSCSSRWRIRAVSTWMVA